MSKKAIFQPFESSASPLYFPASFTYKINNLPLCSEETQAKSTGNDYRLSISIDE